MEKEQTPEKTTDTPSDAQNQDETQPAADQSPEPEPTADTEPEIEQADSTPGTEPVSEPEAVKPIEQPQAPPPDLTATELTESDPLNKTLAYGGFFLLLLTIILVGSSLMNTARFYVVERDGAVEVWQGRFSPKAKQQLVIMPGVEPPAVEKDIYTRLDVYPIIFKYYLDKSDALLDVPGLPDFEGIRGYLNKALTYATSESEIQVAGERIDSINLAVLLYKAERSIGNGTKDGLEAAEAYLGLASELNPDEIEANLIRQKLVSVQRMKAALDAEASIAAEQAAAPADTTTGSETAVATEKDTGVAQKEREAPQQPHATSEKPATEKGSSEQSF